MAAVIISCKNTIQGLYSLHNLQHLLLFSTKSPNRSSKSPNQSSKSPNQSHTNYLVNNLGFSPQQAHSTSAKFRSWNADYSKFSNNANSVVDFLKQRGFDDIHLKKVVSLRPQILASNVDKTLVPKFKVLQDHGFSGSDLVTLISSTASVLDRHMDHIIHDLRAILGSNENLLKFFVKAKIMISTPSLVNLNSNIALLNNEFGVDIGFIRNGILQQPRPYLRDTEVFRNILVRVEEEIGIPRTSGMFLYGLHLLSQCSKKTIESKCQLFKSFGWTEHDVSELMRRCPSAFDKSEENIKKKLGFLMTELGYKPSFLVTRAVLLNLSLEKRLAPRHRVLLVLKEKGLLLNYDFCTVAKRTETQFLKIYIEPYKEDAPGLLELLYQSNKGCADVQASS